MSQTPLDPSSVRWLTLGAAFFFTVMAAATLPNIIQVAVPTPDMLNSPAYRTVLPYAWGFNVAMAATFWAMFIVRSVRPSPAPTDPH